MGTIREFGVFGDQKHAFLKDTSRLDYLEHFMDKWLTARRDRGYAIGAAIIGLVSLYYFQPLAALAFGAAAYFSVRREMNHWYVEGDYADHRNLIMAD